MADIQAVVHEVSLQGRRLLRDLQIHLNRIIATQCDVLVTVK